MGFKALGQITSPVIKANFGIDGDLKSNYFNHFLTLGKDADWFKQGTLGGEGVIDTSGAAAILARYATDADFRKLPFMRTMNFYPGSVVNGKILIDAIFYRDYHGSDSTMYASGASKNGMSPADWSCPVAQSVPDKNEILDVMAHMRRDGSTATDSLWLFGGVSIEQTTGDRYFDFELYQTDITYERATRKFIGYGPDAGHTTWEFDASGNILKAGDVIFSASYGSSTLSSIEARIWVNKSSLGITPKNFNWTGTFDGAASGSTFGYAGIVPKTSGAFYIGLENNISEWAGSFSLIDGANDVLTNYTPGQFMEFAVNFTKLGLDPKTILAISNCGTLFRKLLVKSRASTSFTAALKDFVGPLNLFHDFEAITSADSSLLVCGITNPTSIKIVNPLPGYIYQWHTSDGHIVGDSTGDSIMVDSAGVYIVNQITQIGCAPYFTDTVVVPPFNSICTVLDGGIRQFTGSVAGNEALLKWIYDKESNIGFFEIERSTDGVYFQGVGKVNINSLETGKGEYKFGTPLPEGEENVYYRIKIISDGKKVFYSNIIRLNLQNELENSVRIMPNPASSILQIVFNFFERENVQISIHNFSGSLMRTIKTDITEGNYRLKIPESQSWPEGIYTIRVKSTKGLFTGKVLLRK